MTAPEPIDGRGRYLVGVVKTDPGARDVFRVLFPDAVAVEAAGWRDAFGALDDDTGVEAGEPAAYSVELTPGQLRVIADSDVGNLRYLELEPPPLQRIPPPHAQQSDVGDPGLAPEVPDPPTPPGRVSS